MIEKERTAFVSYRRNLSDMEAQVIRLFLEQRGYDVFLDVKSLRSGKFEPEILQNIETRTFFLVVLMPGSLKRCIREDGSANSEDWLRREIEHAINTKRQIVPVFMNGFSFKKHQKYLVGTLNHLSEYNGVEVFHQYLDDALARLYTYLELQIGEPHSITPIIEASNQTKIEVVIKPPEPTEDELQAEDLYRRAMEKFLVEDFVGAIEDFTEAIHLVPQFAAAYGHRAIMRKNIGDIEGAIADYTKAINFSAQYPYYAEYYYHNRGIAYHIQGEYDKAIDDFTEAIYLNPRFSDAYSRRATSRSRKNDHEGAIRDYNEAIRIDPDDDMPVVNRGVVYSELGDLDAAIKDFTRGLELNPERWEPYNNRAEAFVRLGRFEAAVADFAEAVSRNPHLPSIHISYANAYAEAGRLTEAIEVCTKALDIHPTAAEIYSYRGWLQYLSGNTNQAIDDYAEALHLNPQLPQAHNDWGVLLASQRKYDEAIERYTRAIDLSHPKLQWPYSNRGEMRAHKGDFKGAIADCSESIRVDPTYANAYHIRADAHRILGNLEEAVKDYQKYLDLKGWQEHNDRVEVELTIRALELRLNRS